MSSPRVIVDVDGVVADFLGHLLPAIGYEAGRETIVDYDIKKFLSLAQQERMDQVLREPSFWQTLPVMSGALEGIDEIRERGHEIVWATSPWLPCAGWESIRRDWLKRHFDVAFQEIVYTFRKDVLTAEFYIDDRPESVVAWQRAHSRGIAFLYDAPYNAEFLWPQRLCWEGGEDGQASTEDTFRE